jgi:hypothetical protein
MKAAHIGKRNRQLKSRRKCAIARRGINPRTGRRMHLQSHRQSQAGGGKELRKWRANGVQKACKTARKPHALRSV